MTQRTSAQNRAGHKYFRLLSDEMNKHNITQRLLFDSFKDMPTTEASVKQAFQRVALALFDTDETHTLTTKEFSEVYEQFDGYINLKHGVSVPLPSDEPPLLNEYGVEAK